MELNSAFIGINLEGFSFSELFNNINFPFTPQPDRRREIACVNHPGRPPDRPPVAGCGGLEALGTCPACSETNGDTQLAFGPRPRDTVWRWFPLSRRADSLGLPAGDSDSLRAPRRGAASGLRPCQSRGPHASGIREGPLESLELTGRSGLRLNSAHPIRTSENAWSLLSLALYHTGESLQLLDTDGLSSLSFTMIRGRTWSQSHSLALRA